VNYYGSCLVFPIQPDYRGNLAATSDPVEIVKQSIRAILETRQGERVMLPGYGIPDFVFSVINAGTAGRVKFFLEEQIRDYEPLIDKLEIKVGILDEGGFSPGISQDLNMLAVGIQFTVSGTNTQGNMTFPVWKLRA
jgi:phage baseplate assembly protein W